MVTKTSKLTANTRARLSLPRLKGWLPEVLLASAVACYVIYWTSLTVTKFFAMNAFVYDLGLAMQRMWVSTHPTAVSLSGYLWDLLMSPFQFVISPISLPQSYPLLLAVQSAALGLAAIPLYLIGRAELKSKMASLCIAVAYLLYFPLAGVNYFDFHFQAFFIPLFLLGYYLLSTKHYVWAVSIFLLAGGTTFGYMALISLFSVLSLSIQFSKRTFLGEPLNRPLVILFTTLLIVSTLFFATQYYVLRATESAQAVSLATSTAIAVNPSNSIMLFALLLLPVVFLPLYSRLWALMLLPFGYLSLYSQCCSSTFVFQRQYSSAFIPFVFLGVIFAIVDLSRASGVEPKYLKENLFMRSYQYLRSNRTGRATTMALTVLVITILVATVYQPYGPFNAGSNNDFYVSQTTRVNWTQYNEFTSLVKLIPSSSPYVLFQLDMPELLPRPLPFNQTPLIPTYQDWLNVSVYDAVHNTFPLKLANGQVVSVPIDFAIDNPYGNVPNSNYFTYAWKPNISMYNFISVLFNSGKYGVLGEAGGMLLLERGYSGPTKYYEPYSASFSASQLCDGLTNECPSGLQAISGTVPVGAHLWYGPYTTLSPGTYRVTYTLMATNISPENHYYLGGVADYGRVTFGGAVISGRNFTTSGQWTAISVVIHVNNTYVTVELPGWNEGWSGSVSIKRISVVQLAPAGVDTL